MDEPTTNIAETIERILKDQPTVIRDENGREIIVTSADTQLHALPALEPKHTIAHRSFARLTSLVAYAQDFSPSMSRAYVDADPLGVREHAKACKPRVLLILNPASGAAPLANELHTAQCVVPLDQDFTEWMDLNEQWMKQEDFAAFIEDHIENFVEPSGADMLEIAQTMRIHNNATFSNRVNLSNGSINLQYTEEIEDTAGKRGDMRIPERFAIGIPVFKGGSAFRIEARLRYRISRGDLGISFKLRRVDRVFDQAVDDDIIGVLDNAGIPSYIGTAGNPGIPMSGQLITDL